MPSFDFAGALASGATPQAITSYLSSQGMGNLATTYFNQQQAQPSGFESAINSLKGFVASVASPITTAAGTAVRAVQATPSLVKAVAAGSKNGILNDSTDATQAEKTMAAPILGQNTAVGNTNEQNLGEAAKAASLAVPGVAPENAIGLLGTGTEGAVIGATQGAGQAMTQNQSAADVSKAGLVGAGEGAVAGVALPLAGQAAGKLGGVISDTGATIQDSLAKPGAATVEDSQSVAARALQNPLSPTEQQQAAAQGRTSMVNGKPTIADSPRDIAMQKALQPLVENGDVTANVDKTTKLVNGNEQLSNIDNVNKAIKDQGTQISEGVGTHNKAYNPQDLNKAIFNTEVPSSIKPTDEKVQNLQNAVFKIIQDNTKDTQGLLQARQEFDALVKKDYPNLYEQGMSPTKQYIGNLRETLNDFTAKQLPEGKLPNGVGFRDALQNQHQLINAREEMTQKFVREYPQGSSNMSRFTKAHPSARYLGRFFERRGLGTALSATGAAAAITAAAKNARK